MLAAAGIVFSGLALAWIAVGLLLLAGAFLRWTRIYAGQATEVAALGLGRHGELKVYRQDGEVAEAELLPGSRILGRTVVLAVRVGGRRAIRLIPSDASDPESLRRLRVWLRWRAKLGEGGTTTMPLA